MEFIRPADLFLFGSILALNRSLRCSSGTSRLACREASAEWLIDSLNLLFQGAVIPLLQAWLVATFLSELWPDFAGSLDCDPWVAFGSVLSWLIMAIIGIIVCSMHRRSGHCTIPTTLRRVWMFG